MLTFAILPNGNLTFKADDPADVQEMIDDGKSPDDIMHELFEDSSCNGSYQLFNAAHGNPFVGLCDGLMIAPYMDLDDDGNWSIPEEYFYYSNEISIHMMDTNVLARGEIVEYIRFNQTEDAKGRVDPCY